MTQFDPFPALALPPDALIDRRVPKTLLIENGAFAAGDRRRIREGIEKLRWLAALKPANIGVAEYRDAEREYLEIAVLNLDLRPAARRERLVELVHRAIPYPVFLIVWQHDTPELSLANKRHSLGEAGKTVIDGEIVAVRVHGDCASEPLAAFRDALAMERQPRDTLRSLYQGWIDTVQAFRAATVTGEFCLPPTAAVAADREAALREYWRLGKRIENILSAAGKETQMNRRAEMNMELVRLHAHRKRGTHQTVKQGDTMDKIVAGDPETRSADILAENLNRLKALFPEAFTEGKVDFEVLRQLLGDAVDDREEKYGLNWHGKRRARQLALTPSTGTLRPCPEDSVDWDTTQNLMIEGDNLEVLKLLQKSYAGKVKLIYIDPPYNTGKDFIYRDDYTDSLKNYFELTGQTDGEGKRISSNVETSGRFHTDWLNMIYPRIKIARNLLRNDGFLFVTVDDTEVHNLRSIISDIFGYENFVANAVWEKKYTRANDAQYFSDNHDHVLVFSKNKSDSHLALQPRTEKQLSAYRNLDDHPKGPWKATPLHAKSGGNTSSYTFKTGIVWSPPSGTYRRYSDETMAKMDEENEIWFGHDGCATPARKSFLSEIQSGVTPVTIWGYKEVGHNHEANNELNGLLGRGVFSNPKPTRLIRRILQLTSSPKEREADIVLDFFAGSGTTGQAVFHQNANDGGGRRSILVQLPEPLDPNSKGQRIAAAYCDKLGKVRNISELTKERLRRAARKVKEENPDFDGDLGFRVFKLDTSNIRAWGPKPDDLEGSLLSALDHINAGRTEQDFLYELLLKLGLDLCVPIETRSIAGKSVHSVGAGTLIACLVEAVSRDDAELLACGIADWHDALAPAGETTVVFRDNAFQDDVAKTNLAETLKQRGIGNVRSL